MYIYMYIYSYIYIHIYIYVCTQTCTHIFILPELQSTCICVYVYRCDTTQLYVRHDSFIFVTRPIHMCDMTHHMSDTTHPYVSDDLFTCVT